MNLNDAISRLPQLLKGRFAGNNNAFWINSAADAIAEIERCSCGPGNIRTNMALQMDGGFIPRPSTLFDVKNVKVAGQRIAFTKDMEGVYMDQEDMALKVVEVEQKQSPCSVVVDSSRTSCIVVLNEAVQDGAPFEIMRKVSINSFNGTSKAFDLTLTEGAALPTGSGTLVGWLLFINGEEFRIATSPTCDGTSAIGTVNRTSGQIITGPIENQLLAGMESNALAGAEIQSGSDLVQIVSSVWNPPQSTPAGWSNVLSWTCQLARPVRVFSNNYATIMLSNITIEGYRTFARPTSLTEELDIPKGSETLLAAYLRWKAEADADLASAETKTAEFAFREGLERYGVDQSAANGHSRPRHYGFTPVFGGHK